MKQVLINFRVDEYKKEKAERLCESLGLNLSSLINILLTHSINVGGIPFPLLDQVPSENNIRFEKMWKEHERISAPYKNNKLTEEDIMNVIKEGGRGSR